MRALPLFCLGLTLAGGAGAAEYAFVPPPGVDANIVTAIDGSDSISRAEMEHALGGLAAALRAPEVLAAIRAGREGRIGFAVFVWHQQQMQVVPWTLIGSASDAEAVAAALEARMGVSLDAEVRSGKGYFMGRLTDLSRALDHAGAILAAAPFPAGRAVVNVLGNGSDNMGEAAEPARDRLVASGATINGVVIGPDPEVRAYFRHEVVGGRAAFVLQAPAGDGFDELMRMKLLGDLMAAEDLAHHRL